MENDNEHQSDLDRAVDRAVKRTLEALGFDMRDPIEIQKDVAFLRETRKATKKIGEHVTLLSIGSLVLASLAALWVGIISKATSGH